MTLAVNKAAEEYYPSGLQSDKDSSNTKHLKQLRFYKDYELHSTNFFNSFTRF